MEIAIVSKISLRIKGKSALFIVNPVGTIGADAYLLLDESTKQFGTDDVVCFHGPGDYEVRGIKITGIKGNTHTVYSLQVDGISIIVGHIETLATLQHKLKEHNMVVALCEQKTSASFLTSLAENAVIVYGSTAEATAQGFEKEKLQTLNKYSVTAGKLSPEIETILLT